MPVSLRICHTVDGASLCLGRPTRRECAGSPSPGCPGPFPAPAPARPRIGLTRALTAPDLAACAQPDIQPDHPSSLTRARSAAMRGLSAPTGFLVKDMALEDILTAIRVVAAGDRADRIALRAWRL